MIDESVNLHRLLSEVAAKWLKRPASQNGHGCNISIVEGGGSGENADAIGFKHSGQGSGTTVVEVKISRSDFLRDKLKPHRLEPSIAMGDWRYYLCPEGLIKIEDLPPGFGLLYAKPNGRVRVIVGAAKPTKSWLERSQNYETFKFPEKNHEREASMLVKTITRFDELDDMIKVQRLYNKASRELNDLRIQMHDSSSQISSLRHSRTVLTEKVLYKDFLLSKHTGLLPSEDNLSEYRLLGLSEVRQLYKFKVMISQSKSRKKVDETESDFIEFLSLVLNILKEDALNDFVYSCKMKYRKLNITLDAATLFFNNASKHFTKGDLFAVGHDLESIQYMLSYGVIEAVPNSEEFILTAHFKKLL